MTNSSRPFQPAPEIEIFGKKLIMPALSIITAVGRHDEMLTEAAQSIDNLRRELSQTRVEWVLSLDGNVDTQWVKDKIQPFELDTVILASSGKREGPAIVRNRALREASGDIIATLDSDDRFRFKQMAILYSMLVSSPYLWVAGITQDISVTGAPIDDDCPPPRTGTFALDDYINGATNTGWPFHPCAALAYKHVMVEIGGWEEREPFASTLR